MKKGYAAWNVSLWINNDEGLYLTAKDCVRHTRTLDEAAKMMAQLLEGESTPDGTRYSVTAIRQAMRGL